MIYHTTNPLFGNAPLVLEHSGLPVGWRYERPPELVEELAEGWRATMLRLHLILVPLYLSPCLAVLLAL
jgi:hypothetical protein